MCSDWPANVLKTFEDVHSQHGYIQAHYMQGDHLTVEVIIPPAEDLTLPSSPPEPFRFKILVPPGFPSSSVVPTVCLTEGEHQVRQVEDLLNRQGTAVSKASLSEGSAISNGLPQLIFPWLNGGTPLDASYGLGVWLYTVRNLLVSSDYKPWFTPTIFLRNFRVTDVDRSPLVLLCGSGATRGKRPYMEDVNFSFPSINISGNNYCSVFGVLDGHGGVECSRFAVEELPTQIVSSLRCGQPSSESLFTAFKKTDEEYILSTDSKAGSTATIVLWNQSTGIVNLANAGDSRAVLSRGGVAINVSRDMKASDSCEIARIAHVGGYVSRGRVNGSLAIARAIGDKFLKKGPQSPVTAEPEIVTFRFQIEDEFLIIASDGLWDVMSSQAAVDLAKGLIQNNDILSSLHDGNTYIDERSAIFKRCQEELSKIGDFMANNACNSLNSLDNITVMLILIQRQSSERRDGFMYPRILLCPENHRQEESNSNEPLMESPYILAPLNPIPNLHVTSVFSVDRDSDGEKSESTAIYHSSSMTVEACSSKRGSMDEDDVMNFLLDDSNF